MLQGAHEVQLRWGYPAPGGRQYSLDLRPLNGFDEEFVSESANGMLPAQRAAALLSRCAIPKLGITPIEAIQQISIGDRELLVMHLRRLTFGDRVSSTFFCSHAECGERLDLDLQLSEFTKVGEQPPDPVQEYVFVTNERSFRISFRLPTSADQETAATAAASGDVAGGVLTLLQRCVLRATEVDIGRDIPPDELPEPIVEQLAARMSELDPLAEIRLDVRCPHCGSSTPMLFDAASFLLEELHGRSDALLREIHLLAFHYGWSEADILGMSRRKRRRYIDLLIDALSPEEHGA